MAYILNIETATKNCSVAVANDGTTVVCREFADAGYSHAELLHVFIKEALADADINFADLSAVAISKGPGSYTGLRIGVSAAKGLCYALNIPLIAIDTLEILASKLKISNGLIIPMIDARRMEVYSAIYDADMRKVRDVQAEIITESSFDAIEDDIYLIGDCAEKCKTVLTNKKFHFVDDIVYPSANEMSALSFDKYRKGDTVDVAYFEPNYLKEFFVGK